MNAEILRRLNGRAVRLRPVVQRRWPGEVLPALDEEWRIEISSANEKTFCRRHLARTGHEIDVYSDGIQEYREPGYSILKDQFTVTEHGIEREPLPDRRMAYRDL